MRRVWLTSLVLFLATFAVFSRVLVADFVQWDDGISVYENPHIQGLDWARLRWMFTDAGYGLRYEPLNWLGYALIHQFGGLKPFGYHLANLLLHCLNTVLVFAVIRRLLVAGDRAEKTADRLQAATLPAALGTLLWAISPMRVEPVAHITDLRYCLLLCFLMLSLWFYLRAYQGGAGPRRRRCFYWCSVAAYALSMLSLPFACGYGVVLVALDWHPLGRFEGCGHWWRDSTARQALLEKLPFLVLGGLVLTTLLARLNPTGIYAAEPVDAALAPFPRSMQAFYVWTYYALRPWAPFHLSPVYTTLVGFNPNGLRFWLSAALVIGTTVLLVRRRNQWPWALTLWASHLALLVPVLGITERPHYTTDRYDYLPGLVWAVAIAAGLRAVSRRRDLRTVGMAFALALAVFWGGLSLRQTRVWRDSVTLFQYMIRELGDDPYRSDIQWRLGAVLAGEGKVQEAAQQYEASLQIQPTPQAHLAFAELLETNGDSEGALTNCLAALAWDVTPLDRVQAAQVLATLGRGAEAIDQYRKALASVPDLVPALNNLAWILASDPDATNRNGTEAVQLAERACALTDYQMPVLVGTLAAAYAEAGRFSEAVATAQRARDLAETAGQGEVAEKNRQLLELYRSGRAYHEEEPRSPTTKATSSGKYHSSR
jgi:tetratricopeptide (TPR) repeat protein